MENFLKNVTIFDHPLIAHKITHLCDVTTGTKEFREIVSEIAMLMGYEAFRDLPTEEIEIQAPLSKFKSKIVTEKITIVPILRAGLGMVDGLTQLFPKARVGHIGLYRDEETLRPVEYYCKLPKDAQDGKLSSWIPRSPRAAAQRRRSTLSNSADIRCIKLLSLIASPQGVKKVAEAHPDVKIYIAH